MALSKRLIILRTMVGDEYLDQLLKLNGDQPYHVKQFKQEELLSKVKEKGWTTNIILDQATNDNRYFIEKSTDGEDINRKIRVFLFSKD